MRSKFFKQTTVTVTMSGLVSLALFAGTIGVAWRSVIAFTPAELTREVINQNSDKYTRAVTELSSISAIVFRTDADFKRADSIINTHTRNLRFVRHRMIQIALTNRTFVNAIESELEKAKTNDEALKKFRANPRSLTSLSGAAQAQQSIETLVKRDYQSIKNAGEHLKSAAAAALKKKAAHAKSEVVPGLGPNTSLLVSENYIETLLAASNIVAGVYQRKVKEPARSGAGGGGSGGGSGSGGSSDSSTNEQDQQQYQNCVRKADDDHNACKRNCGSGFFQWACAAHCDAFYLLATAECAFNFNNPF